jgi:hypothetical protein
MARSGGLLRCNITAVIGDTTDMPESEPVTAAPLRRDP